MNQAPRRVKVVKRLIDILVSGILLLCLLPFLLLLSLYIRFSLGGPIFFRQERIGLNQERINLIKFRTMTDQRDSAGNLLPDAVRLTRLGRFLRATSVDELPSLLNVFHGEMSLVGPRPLLVRYLPRYSQEQARRHLVRPGVTGWAQVNGRNQVSWEEKFRLDVWYVDNQSLFLDFKILLLTLQRVIWRSGISADGHATMPEFQGTQKVDP